MDDLKPLAVFAETVASGSMSAAARRLGLSPSAVSQIIRTLELQGGVTLLHRSTRKLSLTEAGERFYPHCRRVLEAARDAAQSLQQARDAPTGELRISAPVGFANHIAPALAPLLSEAPQLRLRLLVDDAMIDLIDARIDIAIRVGRLADSNWVARRLCDFEMILCASPDYLVRHGTPEMPQDLCRHQLLVTELEARYEGVPGESAGELDAGAIPNTSQGLVNKTKATSQPVSMPMDLHAPDGRQQQVHIQSRIVTNNLVALQQMCEHGLGIACLVRADVVPWLQRGALVHVLAPWQRASAPVWAMTPRRDGEEAKIRTALEYLKRYFSALPTSGGH